MPGAVRESRAGCGQLLPGHGSSTVDVSDDASGVALDAQHRNATFAVPYVRRVLTREMLQTCGRVSSTMQGCATYGDGSETLTGWCGVFTITGACSAGAALLRKSRRKIQNRVVSK